MILNSHTKQKKGEFYEKIQKLFLLTLVGFQINFLHGSNTSFSSDGSNDSMSSVHSEKYMESNDFFIEKPNGRGETDYFDSPLVFRAKVNRGKKKLPWLKSQEEDTLTITDPLNGNEETVPMKDFISCEGPDRVLTQKQHLKLVRNLIDTLGDY